MFLTRILPSVRHIRARSRAGFSIVEILVAAVLLSALIIPVVNLLQGSSTNIRRGAMATRALLLAQARIEHLLIVAFDDLATTSSAAETVGTFRVTTSVEDFEGSTDVKRIGVLVRWTDGAARRTRSIGLRTLRCRQEGH